MNMKVEVCKTVGHTCILQSAVVCVTVTFELRCVSVITLECVLLLFVQHSYRVFGGFSY
jgi:hypothetical protein